MESGAQQYSDQNAAKSTFGSANPVVFSVRARDMAVQAHRLRALPPSNLLNRQPFIVSQKRIAAESVD